MSDTIKTLVPKAATYTELYLTADDEIQIYAEDDNQGATYTYSLDEAKALMAGLGRLIWLAENADED